MLNFGGTTSRLLCVSKESLSDANMKCDWSTRNLSSPWMCWKVVVTIHELVFGETRGLHSVESERGRTMQHRICYAVPCRTMEKCA